MGPHPVLLQPGVGEGTVPRGPSPAQRDVQSSRASEVDTHRRWFQAAALHLAELQIGVFDPQVQDIHRLIRRVGQPARQTKPGFAQGLRAADPSLSTSRLAAAANARRRRPSGWRSTHLREGASAPAR